MIDVKFTKLRATLRKESKEIVKSILDNHFNPINKAGTPDTCIFCNSKHSLTKEHVLPRWVFQHDITGKFVTTENEIYQTYDKTTVPACSNCNNHHLGYIERYISQLLETTDPEGFYDNEVCNIIRWVEIIEYKFNVLEFRRKFKASKKHGYIPALAPIPLSVMRSDIDYSPYKAVSELRRSQKRVTVKDKNSHLNSLVVSKTKNKGYYFFHAMNSYIFLEMPQFNIALFYFFNDIFENISFAHERAKQIIQEVYNG